MIECSKRENQIIVTLVEAKDYVTSEELALITSVSSRTIKRCMSSVSTILRNNGGELISKKKMGYAINIIDKDKFNELMIALTIDSNYGSVFNESRLTYVRNLFCLLVSHDEPLTIDKMSEMLFVSVSTLIKNLKIVKQDCSLFGIELCINSSGGYYLKCRELNRRILALELLQGDYRFSINQQYVEKYKELFYHPNYNTLKHIILNVLFNYNVQIYTDATDKVVNYILMSIVRMSKKKKITLDIEIPEDFKKYNAYKCAEDIYMQVWKDAEDDEVIALALILMENENIDLLYYLQVNPHHFFNEVLTLYDDVTQFIKDFFNVNFTDIPSFSTSFISFLLPYFIKNRFEFSSGISYSKDILGNATPHNTLPIIMAKNVLFHLKKIHNLNYSVTDIIRLLYIFCFALNYINYDYKKIRICNAITTQAAIATEFINEISEKYSSQIESYDIVNYWEYEFSKPADVMLLDIFPKIKNIFDVETVYYDMADIQSNYEKALKEALVFGYQFNESINYFSRITRVYQNIVCKDVDELLKLLAFKYSANNKQKFYDNYDIKNFDYSIFKNAVAIILIKHEEKEDEFFDIYDLSKSIKTNNQKPVSTVIVASINLDLTRIKTLYFLLKDLVYDVTTMIDLVTGIDPKDVYTGIVMRSLK